MNNQMRFMTWIFFWPLNSFRSVYFKYNFNHLYERLQTSSLPYLCLMKAQQISEWGSWLGCDYNFKIWYSKSKLIISNKDVLIAHRVGIITSKQSSSNIHRIINIQSSHIIDEIKLTCIIYPVTCFNFKVNEIHIKIFTSHFCIFY